MSIFKRLYSSLLTLACLVVSLLSSCGLDNATEPAEIQYTYHGPDYLRDYQYVEGRVFDLGYPVDDADPNRVEPGRFDIVSPLYVYEYESDRQNLEAVDCKLHIDPTDPTYLPQQSDSLRMAQLTADEYTFYNDSRRGHHYVIFNESRYVGNALGIYMIIERYNSAGEIYPFRVDTIGDLTGEVMQLKSLRSSPNKNNPLHETWSLMWRNCYRMPKGLEIENLLVKVFKGLPNTEGKTSNLDYQEESGFNTGYYLRILGLDQENSQGERIPDNLLDEEFYDPVQGLLIFPHRTPFDTDTTFQNESGQMITALAVLVPNIYFYFSTVEKTENSQYYIETYYREKLVSE